MHPWSTELFSICKSPQVLTSSPHICNWLLCEQLTKQEPENWQPSGTIGIPGPTVAWKRTKSRTQGESSSTNYDVSHNAYGSSTLPELLLILKGTSNLLQTTAVEMVCVSVSNTFKVHSGKAFTCFFLFCFVFCRERERGEGHCSIWLLTNDSRSSVLFKFLKACT